jgi:hypothetical protein
MQELQICAELSQQLGKSGKFEESYQTALRGLKKSLEIVGPKHTATGVFYGMIGAYFT